MLLCQCCKFLSQCVDHKRVEKRLEKFPQLPNMKYFASPLKKLHERTKLGRKHAHPLQHCLCKASLLGHAQKTAKQRDWDCIDKNKMNGPLETMGFVCSFPPPFHPFVPPFSSYAD